MRVLFRFGPRQVSRERATLPLSLLLGALALPFASACGHDSAVDAARQERAAGLVRSARSVPAGPVSGSVLAFSKHSGRDKTASQATAGSTLPELDSHRSALERQLLADWGQQSDRDGQAGFPLVDSKNWRRVRFRGVPTFTAFTYGSDHNTITSAFAVPVQGQPSSRKCMALFEARATQELDVLGGRRSGIREKNGLWREQELLIHTADGEIDMFFKTYRFSVAWAAYPGYSNGCIVYSTVVLWGDEPKLAKKVRDRWVREGFERYVALTADLPYRR